MRSEVPMTPLRLLPAAVLCCTVLAFSQEPPSSGIRPNRTAEPDKSMQATASKPWKIVLSQPADLNAGANPLQQAQIDKYKIDRSRIENGRSLRWGSQIDPIFIVMDGQLGDDTVCYKIRSYVVARDAKDSDSVHPVAYSTCQPASRYRLRTTQIRIDSPNR
jgi:hypothetical protein